MSVMFGYTVSLVVRRRRGRWKWRCNVFEIVGTKQCFSRASRRLDLFWVGGAVLVRSKQVGDVGSGGGDTSTMLFESVGAL